MYDHIIVGAGSSGATLAARLSEDANRTVLLLEAGPDYRSAAAPPEMQSPNGHRMIAHAHLDRFNQVGLLARRTAAQAPTRFLRGRGVGGSSAINAQIAMRAVPEDLDLWATEGCAGWSWADTLPSFIRLEDDVLYGDEPYHGRGGPIPIDRAPGAAWGAVDLAFAAAAVDLGYQVDDDHNAPVNSGLSTCAMNRREGRRVTVNDGYLEPARDRPNLTIRGDALVDRVLFNGTRATGVRVRLDGAWSEIDGREVILSAGAIHTPPLLIRSGIGPAAELRALGVEVLRDAPVGKNLGEHAAVWISFDLAPHAQPDGNDARLTNCCIRSDSGLPEGERNDLLLTSINLIGDDERTTTTGMIGVKLYRTFSHGELRVRSRDPEAHPDVEMRLLADRRDLTRLRHGLDRLWAFIAHPAVRAIGANPRGFFTGRPLPTLPTEEERDDFLLAECTDDAHPVGTCRMGDPTDPRAVVDPACRVIGVEGLRVVDASLMPECPRANTHLTAVMIGEHAAELILAGA